MEADSLDLGHPDQCVEYGSVIMKGSICTLTVSALLLSSAAQADSWFQKCESALATPPFRKLNEFYLSNPDVLKPQLCFRLNDREFLVSQTNVGRVLQGLYYFNATDGSYEFPDGSYRAGFSVPLEFDGPNKKHFALIRTDNLHHGTWDATYEVLYLIPKENGRAFKLEPLFYVNEDPASGMCGDSMKEGVAANIDSVVVEHGGSPRATLLFNITEQDCPNGEMRSVQRRFLWKSNGFVEQRH